MMMANACEKGTESWLLFKEEEATLGSLEACVFVCFLCE